METVLKSILPAQTLGIEVAEWSNGRVVLSAPLDRNLNDKGTAFAGSIDALLDLAGWSAITLALRDAGIAAEVMIVKSETEYAAAVRADMASVAEITASETERVLQELQTRGRSRIALHSRLLSEGTESAAMSAQYAIMVPGNLYHPD